MDNNTNLLEAISDQCSLLENIDANQGLRLLQSFEKLSSNDSREKAIEFIEVMADLEGTRSAIQ